RATGEIEVALELAVFLRELGPANDEPVRLEQRADVDVGQEPRVRRVAYPLELVELDRRERVDRSDLVDDEHLAAESGHARELGDDKLWTQDVVQRAEGPG